MAVEAVISYDVSDWQDEFKDALEALDWHFTFGGKRMPFSTCWARFDPPATEAQAEATALADFKKAAQQVQVTHPSFRVERYYVAAFNRPPATVAHWSKD